MASNVSFVKTDIVDGPSENLKTPDMNFSFVHSDNLAY